MSKKKRRKPRKPGKALAYVVVSTAPRVLRLRNGTRLKQAIKGVELYLSSGGNVYSLTEYGLRPLRINYYKKKNYLKVTKGGHHQGQGYPYVKSGGKTYRVHTLMALAWRGAIEEGMETDHINGNIDDFSYDNIRIITVEENNRCGGILRRLRNASVKYGLPELNPRHMSREELLERFERYKDIPGRLITQSIRMEAEGLLNHKSTIKI